MNSFTNNQKENNPQIIKKTGSRNPWAWVPSLYFAEGIPYVIVVTLSLIMFKRFGLSNTDIALYTSWLYLPWVIKPLWSPFIDILKTKRYWIILMQLLIGASLAGIAFTIPVSGSIQYIMAFLWLLAFSSATHDIAADGFYMLSLEQGQQSYFVGIRSTFYRLAMIAGQGLLVIIAGSIETGTGLEPVYLTVKASYNQQTGQSIDTISEIKKKNGFISQKIISINLQNTDIQGFDSLKKEVRNKNITNGFYENIPKNIPISDKPGFWTSYVSGPIQKFLKKHFGQDNTLKAKSRIGNLNTGWIKINYKPEKGEKIILNLENSSGSKDINLIEGARLEFNEKNWNQVAYVLFQIDPKVTKDSETVFIGRSGNIALAWAVTFGIVAFFFIVLCVYHRFILPYPESDKVNPEHSLKKSLHVFLKIFADFFRKKRIGIALLFILFYRLAEAQLLKLAVPFLLDPAEAGGLGLSTSQIGIYYGTLGIIALLLGGIVGGVAISRKGLKYWIWWMVAAIHIPDLIYVYFSSARPESELLIASGVVLEQFGYGFGVTAFMMYIIYIANGTYKTAHYAIATGFMALGMMLPGLFSGWLQEIIGYQNFFIWVVLCTIPGVAIIAFLRIDPEFGKIAKKD